jgi:hypothetical protein
MSNGQAQYQVQGQANGSASQPNGPESPNSSRLHRLSLDSRDTPKVYDGNYGSQDGGSQIGSPLQHAQATPPKLQQSYSANEVPTMRSTANGISSVNSTPNSHAQQHLHNHNASLGRIPPNAMNNRLSREMTATEGASLREAQNGGYQSIQSALHASAPPFGPSLTQGMSQAPLPSPMTSPTAQQTYPVQGYYNGYGMNGINMLSMGMQNMQIGQPIYSPHNPYANYSAIYTQSPPPLRDSQARVIQQRRQNDGEGLLSFQGVRSMLTFL